MTCIYGCKTDGRPCPRPHTCHTLWPKLAEQRAIDEQAKTDRQAACCTGNCRQGRDCAEHASYGLGDAIKDVVLVLAGVAMVAFLAGWISKFWHG